MSKSVQPMTVHQFADFIQVKPKTVYKWINEGRCPQITRIGREIRFQMADVQDWLDAQKEVK